MIDVPQAIGLTFVSWSTHVLVVEIYCHQLLKNTVEDNSILFSTIQYRAIEQIAAGLIKRKGGKNSAEIVAALKKVATVSKRNVIAHSIIMTDDKYSKLELLKRDLGKGHRLRITTLSNEELSEHVHALADAAIDFQRMTNISDKNIRQYVMDLKDIK